MYENRKMYKFILCDVLSIMYTTRIFILILIVYIYNTKHIYNILNTSQRITYFHT